MIWIYILSGFALVGGLLAWWLTYFQRKMLRDARRKYRQCASLQLEEIGDLAVQCICIYDEKLEITPDLKDPVRTAQMLDEGLFSMPVVSAFSQRRRQWDLIEPFGALLGELLRLCTNATWEKQSGSPPRLRIRMGNAEVRVCPFNEIIRPLATSRKGQIGELVSEVLGSNDTLLRAREESQDPWQRAEGELPDVPQGRTEKPFPPRDETYPYHSERRPDPVLAPTEDPPRAAKATRTFNRGLAETDLGRMDKAIGHYLSVLRITDVPADLRIDTLLGLASAYETKGEWDKSAAYARQALADAGAAPAQRAGALLHLGVAQGNKGQIGEASDAFDRVLKMPESTVQQKAGALSNLGLLKAREGEYENAIAYLDQAIEIAEAPRGTRAQALAARGWSSFRVSGDPDILIEDTRKALELDPQLTAYRANLGLGFLLKGQQDRAETEYERALERAQPEWVEQYISDLKGAITKHGVIELGKDMLAKLEKQLHHLRGSRP